MGTCMGTYMGTYMGTCMGTCTGRIYIVITYKHIAVLQLMMFGENGAFPPTRDGCIHSLSMRERG